MRIEFDFYATLREAVGEKHLDREVADDATVADALGTVAAEYDDLGPLVFDGDGDIRPSITVSINGEPLSPAEDRGAVTLADDDTLVVAPGVSGGMR